MQIDYPFHLNTRGQTEKTDEEEHVRDLIEQVLFTTPGERINRPTFGVGLRRLVFDCNSDPLSTATQFLVHAALQKWLGDLIEVAAVEVENPGSTLQITVRYTIRRTQQAQQALFVQEG